MAHESGTRQRTARRGRVLVVDDDGLVAHAIALVLRDENDVSVSTDAADALERLSSDEPFDVILCDLMMPGLSGEQLYDAVVAVRPEIAARFVFITGGGATHSARAFLRRVPNEQVEKPPEAIELRAVVRRRVAAQIGIEKDPRAARA
jgi:DNA-binding NtrC family response regulator